MIETIETIETDGEVFKNGNPLTVRVVTEEYQVPFLSRSRFSGLFDVSSSTHPLPCS
jgi:hypothetical protein